MKLFDYIKNMDRRNSLAAACETSPDYLWQVATGWNGRKAGHQLARKIEVATMGIVTRYDIRPDIFGPAPVANGSARKGKRKRAA